jgi:hypothetical protein
MLLSLAERRLGIAEQLLGHSRERRAKGYPGGSP